jgi:excisionase family DNA binding protein
MEHFMTSEEIAELLHVDPVTIRRLVNKGELSAYRIGADYRFAPSDLQDYLQRQRISAHAQNESGASSSNPLDQFAQGLRKIIQRKDTTPSELVGRFDRFTKRARHVLTLAQEEARRFQHTYIGTEHLLLGLVREEEGIASQVLRNLGIEVDQVRQAIEAIIGRGERIVLGEVGLTPRAKKVIELAVDEARRLKHHFIGTEHILLGLLREGDGIAAGVLENFGLHLEQVRTETLRVLREKQQGQEETSATPSVPSEASTLLTEDEPGLPCTSCGARCPGYFRYCFNCGQPLIHEEQSNHGEEN